MTCKLPSLLVLILSVLASAGLPAWEFDAPRDLQVWQPNAHLDNVTIADGVCHARAIDTDPFLLCAV